jgi:ribosome-associated protein
MSTELDKIIIEALDDLKANDTTSVDVTELSDVMDTLIIASGTSSRHVKALANNVVVEAKSKGHQPIGVEGVDEGEWVLVDFGDTVVHIMQPTTRDFYDLERLWSTEPSSRSDDTLPE